MAINLIYLKEIPKTFEAVRYDGENADEITRFCGRHGAQIDWKTNEDDITVGTLHTAAGTEKVTRNCYVASDDKDQVFRVLKELVEHPQHQRYEILPEPDAEPEA